MRVRDETFGARRIGARWLAISRLGPEQTRASGWVISKAYRQGHGRAGRQRRCRFEIAALCLASRLCEARSDRAASYMNAAAPISLKRRENFVVVRKGTEERKRALADLAIARRAVSFPCTTASPFLQEREWSGRETSEIARAHLSPHFAQCGRSNENKR